MGREHNPKIKLTQDEYNSTFHTTHYERKTLKSGEEVAYAVHRARLRLDNDPIRKLVVSKRDRYGYTLQQIAWMADLPERTVNRIAYNEQDVTHIDTIDRICLAFDTSIREVYGE